MSSSTETSLIASRRRSVPVNVGGVIIGGDAPIVVQSMTNTDTADIAATTAQIAALARAGSEIVRITVDRDEAAAACRTSETGWPRWASACRSSVISTERLGLPYRAVFRHFAVGGDDATLVLSAPNPVTRRLLERHGAVLRWRTSTSSSATRRSPRSP